MVNQSPAHFLSSFPITSALCSSHFQSLVYFYGFRFCPQRHGVIFVVQKDMGFNLYRVHKDIVNQSLAHFVVFIFAVSHDQSIFTAISDFWFVFVRHDQPISSTLFFFFFRRDE